MEPLGDTPPCGILELSFDLAPVSQQARSVPKKNFIDLIRSTTRTAGYIFSCDVQLTVEWLIDEETRYETDRAPDVDNILKPLIDALVGPDGLLIDDNQVQAVSCSWIDWNNKNECLRIELRFWEDEWLPKKDLRFVQFSDGLCLPMPGGVPPQWSLLLLETYAKSLAARSAAMKLGIPLAAANLVMPAQRLFHRTRIHDFPVLNEAEFRAQLSN